VYEPTADSTEDEIKTFYEELKQVLKQVKNNEIKKIMGDFNAKVGEGRFEALVGPYGLGLRNDRGQRLCQFCQEENMKITNIWYNLPPRRLYTWNRPDNINKRYGTSAKMKRSMHLSGRRCALRPCSLDGGNQNYDNQNPCTKDRLRKT